MQRKYFDFCAFVGRKIVPDADYNYKTDAMLSDMKYARVHASAFVHNGAVDYSFEHGNREAIEISKKNKRLFPLAVVPSTADIESGNENYFEEILKDGVRGFVVLNNSRLHSTLLPKSIEKMAKALIKYKRPLIIDNVISDEQYVRAGNIAEAFPELSIIMYGTRWNESRIFWEVMSNYKNLYFEISSNHTNDILELTKKYFGIERVLFSSCWPIKSMGAMKAMVEYADISEEDKDKVAYGNACALFGVSPDELKLYDENECLLDEIAKEADAGKPISVEVIDAHCHMSKVGCAVNNNIMINSDCHKMAQKMERLGINKALIAPWNGICYSGVGGNEESLEAYKNYSEKFLAFSCANVNYSDDLDAVIKYHKENPDIFIGIKPYPPYQKFNFTDEICKGWFEYANEHHLLALIHAASAPTAEEIDVLSDIYKNVTFILAHSGASFDTARANAAVARKHNNVVLDITYTSTINGMVEFLVKEVGADKVLYGSDMPMREPSPQLAWVCFAKLPIEDKKKILAENIKRIMNERI